MEDPDRLDIFGFELSKGDTVAFVDGGNHLGIGTVNEFHTCRGKTISIKFGGLYVTKYPCDVAKRVLEPADLKLIKFTIGSDQ